MAPRAGQRPTVLVLGTRPEIIKLAPVIRALEARGTPFRIVHTGQHYSPELDAVFFEELELPLPHRNLGIGSHAAPVQVARALEGLQAVLTELRPLSVLVQGDTNSTLAGALAARQLQLPLAHVEAGLRSRDRTMPEELNRILADHMADVLYAPTVGAAENLGSEGISASQVVVTGNTIVDAVEAHLPRAPKRLPAAAAPPSGPYGVVTVHRAENLSDSDRFRGILEGCRRVSDALGLPLLFPMHPHARRRLRELRLAARGLHVIDSLGYLPFLRLLSGAQLVLTDSGGLQEEACVLHVPCVTLRDNTERPESLEVGSNRLAGTAPDDILANARAAHAAPRGWTNPFGDGRAGTRIVDDLLARGWATAQLTVPAGSRRGRPS